LKEGKIPHRQGFTSTTSNASLDQRRMRGAVDFRHRVSGLVQRRVEGLPRFSAVPSNAGLALFIS